ncbi:hypothetical protein [Hymenobacter psychrotolerans]|uniref:Uncharacterized protein n=1 Tax=Hymenobacter psychrotolerans DSM 18569 TaxID=1121959 RepID=A0A1M6ZAN3_9BACT|nr:hypothetical protein [Hymenobacter psychrotolerans]SHL27508.1 hypothetical protein SAMN02746009_02475 [Hymenobacter psychrotolerans DSM 18569]
MIQDPEDELLDQSLRETFSDFDLTPASHIWAGVEGQLAAMPKVPRAVPYKLLLPLAGLVGVGVGWLLPREDVAPSAHKTEQSVVSAKAPRAATLQRAPALALAPDAPDVALRRQQPTRSLVSAGKGPVVASRPAVPPQSTAPAPSAEVSTAIAQQTPAPDLTPVAAPEVVAPDTMSADVAQEAVAADSQRTLVVGAAPQIVSDPAASNMVAGKAATAGTFRPDGAARERRTEYRTATHRRAEKGRSFRKRLVHLTQQVRHLFSPRRSKAAAQPDF